MAVDILILLTWTTWDRAPQLDEAVADHLQRLLPLLAQKAHGRLLEISIVPSHVHTVAELGAKYDIPALAQSLKGASARLVNQSAGGRIAVRWANGYDARSFGRRQLASVRRYLDTQGTHHGAPLLARWTWAPAPPQTVLQDASLAEPGLVRPSFRTRF